MASSLERIQKMLKQARIYIAANQPLLAIPELEKVVAKVPKSADGWFLLGQSNGMLGDHIEAERCFRRALALVPNNRDIQFGLALTLTHQGRHADALPVFRKMVVGDDLPPVGLAYNLGLCHLQLDQYQEAVDVFASLLRRVDKADFHFVLGMAYQGLNKNREALAAYQEAAKRGVTGYTVNLNSGVCCYGLQDYVAAQAYAISALEATPDDDTALHNLAVAYLAAGDVSDALDVAQRGVSLRTAFSRLSMLGYSPKHTLREVRDAHVRIAADYPRPLRPLDLMNYAGTGKIRLGFITGDLRQHPVAHFLEGLLPAINRTDFDVHVYATAAKKDAVTERFMAMDCIWRDVSAMSDEAVATTVRDDRIDIAFDISGNTSTGRPGVFAMRAAPTQVSYLGYSSTTGLPEMDYFMTDARLDPPSEGGDAYTEKLIRLGDVLHAARRDCRGGIAATGAQRLPHAGIVRAGV